MKFYRTTGFIYKIKKLGDSDKIIWILSKDHGKISSIAKGISKSKSRKKGHIDLMNYNKFAFHKGRNFDIISETQNLEHFQGLKKVFTYEFFYLAELMDKIIADDEEVRKIYQLLYNFLIISTNENFQKNLAYFEIHLMKLIGFEPNLKTYESSEIELNSNKPIYLSHTSPGYSYKKNSNFQITTDTIKIQRYIISNKLEQMKLLNLNKTQLKEVLKVNKHWMEIILDRKLNSLKYL